MIFNPFAHCPLDPRIMRTQELLILYENMRRQPFVYLANCPPIHRFLDVAPYSGDYYVNENDGLVRHFPDPQSGLFSKSNLPKRGISCFSPHTTPHGRQVSVPYQSKCFILTEVSLPSGWRFRYDRDLNFLLTDGSISGVAHFLLYSAVPLSVTEFCASPSSFNWLPCEIAEGAEAKFALQGEYDSENGQETACTLDTLRTIVYFWNHIGLSAQEMMFLADAHYTIATKKKPLRYLAVPMLQCVLNVLTSHVVSIAVVDLYDMTCKHIRKAILSVSIFKCNRWYFMAQHNRRI